MRGIPRHLNTRDDYLYIRDELPVDQWRPRFQDLLDKRFAWLATGPLAEGDVGIEDDTHRVVEHVDEQGQVYERIQEVLSEDPNAPLFRLGFSVAEVGGVIDGRTGPR